MRATASIMIYPSTPPCLVGSIESDRPRQHQCTDSQHLATTGFYDRFQVTAPEVYIYRVTSEVLVPGLSKTSAATVISSSRIL